MGKTLIHGCYDPVTFQTLRELGSVHFGFDLRPRSPALVTMRELTQFLTTLGAEKTHLVLENEKPEVIRAILDLLKAAPEIVLEFRDLHPVTFYSQFPKKFSWMYDPAGDWKNILESPQLDSLLLPIGLRDHLKSHAELWRRIDERNLPVYLHAQNFEQAARVLDPEVSLSVDLTTEVETSYRKVDQERLRKLKFWRNYESPHS